MITDEEYEKIKYEFPKIDWMRFACYLQERGSTKNVFRKIETEKYQTRWHLMIGEFNINEEDTSFDYVVKTAKDKMEEVVEDMQADLIYAKKFI